MSGEEQNREDRQQDLVDLYYGEASPEVVGRVSSDPALRAEFEQLSATLDALKQYDAPEPDSGFEARLWGRVSSQMPKEFERPVPSKGKVLPFRSVRHWATWGAIAAGLLVAFVAGRFTADGPQVQAPVATASDEPIRERVLLLAVGDHLERSQAVIVELMNAPERRVYDLTTEQERAEDLIQENRLFRQTAMSTGDRAVAGLLEDLERALLEIAHSPSQLSSPGLEGLRKRLESQGILFKVRVVESTIRDREREDIEHRGSSEINSSRTSL